MNNNEKSVEKAVEKQTFTLRPLMDEDLYPMLDIIAKVCPDNLTPTLMKVMDKMGDIEQMTGEEMTDDDKAKMTAQIVNDIGVDVVMELAVTVIKNLSTVKDEVYALLSSLSGIPADQIRKMRLGTTPKMIWAIVQDIKNQSFFEDASESS